jgi:hypothetical protein
MLDNETCADPKTPTVSKSQAKKSTLNAKGPRFQHNIPKPNSMAIAKTKTKVTVKRASTSKAHDLVRKLKSNKSSAIIRNNLFRMPVLDNVTRWNTVYECLSYYKAISNNEDIKQELIADKKLGIDVNDFINSEEERQEVDECLSILKEVKTVSLISQGNC